MASSGIRALRGCRALLAPAKSSASSAAEVIKTTTSKQPKPKPKPKATAKPKPTKTAKATPSASTTEPKRASGIQKVSPISPQLQTFLGAPEASRSDAVKQIWSYIKLHNLQVHFPPFFLLFLFYGLQFFFQECGMSINCLARHGIVSLDYPATDSGRWGQLKVSPKALH